MGEKHNMAEKKLKCYGAIDSNGEVCQINSCQYKKWASDYKKDLKSYFDVRRHYSDPDCSYCKGTDHSFFEDLEIFLNEQEEKMSDRLQGRFQYSFTEGKGIEVSSVDSEGKTVKIFYLRSDQLGFSAPVNEKSYPYDLYIDKYEDKDKAAEQVVKWIAMSRTIGGSFLWPESFHKLYNARRGGKITSDRQYYIQDRVDLTLWEIKNWYSGKGENDILERWREANLERWLGHFKSFETYIDYFKFKDFISISTDELYNPINIITGESDAPIRGSEGKNPKPAITDQMELGDLENMLNKLNEKIVERSNKMTEIISAASRKGEFTYNRLCGNIDSIIS